MVKSLKDIVIFIVVIAWVASLVHNHLDATYHVPTTVQIVMAAVAAFLFGDRVISGNRRKNGK